MKSERGNRPDTVLVQRFAAVMLCSETFHFLPTAGYCFFFPISETFNVVQMEGCYPAIAQPVDQTCDAEHHTHFFLPFFLKMICFWDLR